ncbi:MAG TPA: suppressor of fused domain protein [Planctomycetota bacterium]|nr:suppressor of fused domain protein [Planctomycetota bacterium]
MSDEDDDDAPGWDAIDAALARVYGQTKPLHYGSPKPVSLGGSLDGISVFQNPTLPHWHYITYGLTELYGKVSSDAEHSGWGFELCFRLKRGPEQQPPIWALSLLQNLADYVWKSKRVLEPGQTMDFRGPISMGQAPTELSAAFFAADPDLGHIQTPNGKVAFVTVVGILNAEIPLAKANAAAFQARLAAGNRLLVTDLDRKTTPPEAPAKRKNPFGFE